MEKEDFRKYKKYTGWSWMEYEEIESIESVGIIQTFDLQVRRNNNFILENGILTHNSGKTVSKMTILENYAKTHKIIHLNDVNSEMWYAKKPSRKKLELYELRKEPAGLDIMNFTLPSFKLAATRSEINKIDKFVRINPAHLRPADWHALLDLRKAGQQLAFNSIWNAQEFMSVEDLLNSIKKSNIHTMTKDRIILRLQNLIDQDVFGDRESNDIDELLMNNKIINFETSHIEDSALLRGFSTYLLNIIIEYARQRKNERPFFVAIEEFEYLVSEDTRDSEFEKHLNSLFRRTRTFGVSVMIVQQSIKDIERAVGRGGIIGNISDWVIHKIRHPSQLKVLKESMGVDASFYIDVVPTLDRGQALYIDDQTNVKAGKVMLPGCDHKFEEKVRIYVE